MTLHKSSASADVPICLHGVRFRLGEEDHGGDGSTRYAQLLSSLRFRSIEPQADLNRLDWTRLSMPFRQPPSIDDAAVSAQSSAQLCSLFGGQLIVFSPISFSAVLSEIALLRWHWVGSVPPGLVCCRLTESCRSVQCRFPLPRVATIGCHSPRSNNNSVLIRRCISCSIASSEHLPFARTSVMASSLQAKSPLPSSHEKPHI
ncbi:hypothetical protein CC80DRAFT_216634 [Byssothecium circinans]|uniref:Uncharacterized protein n=1 Tax=Byssothecium circinans TaxID=147558 RepID=A0A6A5TE71_9PLEO|nr:hypothetical protein CC80DRAFT_216634 [Byssothecium circinans]